MTFEAYRDALLKIALEQGCEAAEVYAQEAEEFSVEVMEQQIDSYSVSRSMGLSVRVCLEGKNGYAYTELFEDPQGLVARAMDNARASETEDVHPMQGASDYPAVTLPENPLESLTDAQRIDLAMELEKRTLPMDPRCTRVADNQVAFVKGKTHIANTLGLRASRDHSVALCYVCPVLQEGEQMQDGLAFRTGAQVFDLEGCAKEAIADAARKFGASTIPSGKYPVVLEKHAASSLLAGFFSLFSGESAQKGLSLLAGKEGQVIAAPCLSIVDDPLLEANPRSFDDEGVPSVRTEVVKDGVLKTLLHNLKTAHKAGCASTSYGGRGSAASPVGVAPSNFMIVPGEKSYEELLETMGEGLIIRDVSGLHAGLDPISGDFSLLAGGWLRKDGKLQPVEQITVAGNFFTLLKEVEEVGADLWLGIPQGSVVASPSLRVQGLMVSGS
ncbi:MAG: TldD/PmbA family protein [Clostridia bacterium]|nr:TldD/PmbA family protein [Clostridia bacterium]